MISQQLHLSFHAAATWFMVGLIWIIQLVHYPMFEFLDRAAFKRSHAFHSTVITFIVMPAMLLELALSALVLWRGGLEDCPALVGFALVVVVWAMTLFVMLPLHSRLQSEGYQPDVHAALCRWNWARTLAWSARGVIVVFWL